MGCCGIGTFCCAVGIGSDFVLLRRNDVDRQTQEGDKCIENEVFFMDEVFFIRSTAKGAVTFPCAGIILIKLAGMISALFWRHPE